MRCARKVKNSGEKLNRANPRREGRGNKNGRKGLIDLGQIQVHSR